MKKLILSSLLVIAVANLAPVQAAVIIPSATNGDNHDSYIYSPSFGGGGVSGSSTFRVTYRDNWDVTKYLVAFDDLNSVVGVGNTVSSAILTLTAGYYVNAPTNFVDAPGTISVYRVLKDWDNNATWYTTDGSTSWGTAGLQAGVDYAATPLDSLSYLSFPGSASKLDFDVTSTVQDWISNPTNDHGFLVQWSSGNNIQWVFHGSGAGTETNRPSLSLDIIPVPEPSALSLLGLCLLMMFGIRTFFPRRRRAQAIG